MMRPVVLFMLSFNLGCAYANAFSSKPSPQVEFADADVPPGTGWNCFDRNDGKTMETLCERTAELCDASRQREGGSGAAVSVCQPRERAFCFYQDIDPTKAAVLLAVGDKYKQYGCFGLLEECNQFRKNHVEVAATGSGVMAISSCRELP